MSFQRHNEFGDAARRHDRCRGPKLLLHAVEQAVEHGCRTEHDAAAHGVARIFADGALRLVQADAGELGRAAGQRLERDLQAGADAAAAIDAVLVDGRDGRRRAHIHDEQRRAIVMDGRDGGDDEVAADLRGIVHADVQARADAGADNEAVLPRQLADGGAERIEHRRHDGGDDRAVDHGRNDVEQRQNVLELRTVLIGRLDGVRCHARLKQDVVPLDAAEDDVGIADINCKDHKVSSSNRSFTQQTALPPSTVTMPQLGARPPQAPGFSSQRPPSCLQ